MAHTREHEAFARLDRAADRARYCANTCAQVAKDLRHYDDKLAKRNAETAINVLAQALTELAAANAEIKP